MTTIFTRNLVIFILSAVLLKCIINMHSNNTLYNKSNIEISEYRGGGITGLEKNLTKDETASRQSCLGANTGFPIANTGSTIFSKSKVNNNSVGTVNIIHSYGTYRIQSSTDTSPVSDLIAENKIIIKVTPQLSEIIYQRMRESADVEYILSGTELQEIYSNSNIVKIEKIKLRSNQGEYYLLELDPDMKTSSYGEKYLSRLDKIRRFTNF